jgi:acetyltransferase
MGGNDVAAGQMILTQANIPNFPYPIPPPALFVYMRNTPITCAACMKPRSLATGLRIHRSQRRRRTHRHVRKSGRTILTEYESKQLLRLIASPPLRRASPAATEDAVKEPTISVTGGAQTALETIPTRPMSAVWRSI